MKKSRVGGCLVENCLVENHLVDVHLVKFIRSTVFDHMNKGKANGRMNKNKLIDILIVYADKLHLVE